MSTRDMVSWTTLIVGYEQHEQGNKALHCFEHLQLNNVTSNANAYISYLKPLVSIGEISEGRGVHVDIERRQLLRASSL